jgi:hypothetical protein
MFASSADGTVTFARGDLMVGQGGNDAIRLAA